MKKIILALCLPAFLIGCKSGNDKKMEQPVSKNVQLIKGQVDDAPDGRLNILGYFVDPQYGGTVLDNNVRLELPHDFDTLSLNAFDTYNAVDPRGSQLVPMLASDMFLDLENTLSSGLKNELYLAGKFYGFELYSEDVLSGIVYPASTIEFMDYVMGKSDNALVGYYYALIYSAGEVEILGNTSLVNETPDDSNSTYTTTFNYDINFKKGWNLYKYEVIKVGTSDNKSQYPLHISHNATQFRSLDLKFIHKPL